MPKRKPMKDADYLSFIHELPCVVTRAYTDIQACHVSFAAPQYGAYGRGKGQKASDRWVVPMTAAEHIRQHDMNERAFWDLTGLDPHLICLILYGLFCEAGMDAVDDARRIIAGGLPHARTF